MKNKLKSNKAITLIALIITIIVMLILVGVVVSVVINSNLLGTAKSAVDRTKAEYEKEANFGEKVTIGETEYNSIQEYVGIEPEEFGPGKRASKNEDYTIGGKTAIIPEGFTLSGYTGGNLGESETTIEGGLVIYDIPAGTTIDWTNETQVNTARRTYNQYVWIPVNFAKQDGATYETDTNFNNVWKRSIWGNNARVTTQTSTSFPGTDRPWSNYTEPYSYKESGVNADYDGTGTGKTGIADELENMKKSVYKYGGFYIARYEAGIPTTETPRTSASASTKSTLKFVQDAYPYNFVCWGDPSTSESSPDKGMGSISKYGAVALSRGLEFASGSTAVDSMLCSGVAWDAMLDFVKDSSHNVTNSTGWGNYNNVLLTTGASEINKVKNIYDIAGNCNEWTTEASVSSRRIIRGRQLPWQWLFISSL